MTLKPSWYPPDSFKAQGLQAGAAGVYTDITLIAPDHAAPGETVQAIAVVENIYSQTFAVTVTGIAGSNNLKFGELSRWINPYDSYSWTDSFVMPSQPITLVVTAWYLAGSDWIRDDEDSKVIQILEGAKFSNLSVTYRGA